MLSTTRSAELDELNAEVEDEHSGSSHDRRKRGFTFVAVAKGETVEAYVIHDLDEAGALSNSTGGERVEHVADWDLESTVLGVSVNVVGSLLPYDTNTNSSSSGGGILVTSVCAQGVGWSWIETDRWTVVKTQFQQILGSDSGAGSDMQSDFEKSARKSTGGGSGVNAVNALRTQDHELREDEYESSQPVPLSTASQRPMSIPGGDKYVNFWLCLEGYLSVLLL